MDLIAPLLLVLGAATAYASITQSKRIAAEVNLARDLIARQHRVIATSLQPSSLADRAGILLDDPPGVVLYKLDLAWARAMRDAEDPRVVDSES